MLRIARNLFHSQQAGLVMVLLLLGSVVALAAGNARNPFTGEEYNKLLNAATLMETATQASFFAIMAAGASLVIISAGIDLSVGAIYALAGVGGAMALRALQIDSGLSVVASLAICAGIGIFCGLLNGAMVVGLRVHPFVVTLGTMWIFRGVAFVMSGAATLVVPEAQTRAAKASLGLSETLHPVPLLAMILITVAGALYLNRTVWGRHNYAVGGNMEAARYSGLPINRILISVYALSGWTAGIAAFLGSSYYGSASCIDGSGYELYVIASAVVGGVSLNGGRGNIVGAMLGALLIALIRQSIVILQFNPQFEWIVVGLAIVLAVFLDRLKTDLSARRLALAAQAVRASSTTESRSET